jgi:NAD-dependent dihydropyrimidine dehydrogenase PreA subunit
MSVLINFKICDNAKECNGVAVCPTGALTWNEKKKTIQVDNGKCSSCRKCEKGCMVDAIHVARNEKEFEKIKKEIEMDSRKTSDLFVDRYGAAPIHLAFLIGEDKFQLEVEQSDKLVAAEMFCDDSIECLLKSVPMKELLSDCEVKYRKVETGKELMKKYKIKKLPALLFFEKGKVLGKIEGYYENKQKDVLVKKIKTIIKK